MRQSLIIRLSKLQQVVLRESRVKLSQSNWFFFSRSECLKDIVVGKREKVISPRLTLWYSFGMNKNRGKDYNDKRHCAHTRPLKQLHDLARAVESVARAVV